MGALEIISRSSVFSRVAWGIVLGFVVLHGATLLFYNHEKMVAEAAVFATSTAERALTLNALSRSNPEILELIESPGFSMTRAEQPAPAPRRIWPHSDEIRGVLVAALREAGHLRPDEVQFWYNVSRGNMLLTLQLPDADGWMLVRAQSPGARGHSVIAAFWTSLLGVLVLVLVLLLTRRFTRSLPRFVEAAERVGRDASLAALPERGPREIRQLGRAFNAMQSRVSNLLNERNTMLGALSHDVRTLVTRLSLRMDEIEDAGQREKARQDVEAIGGILEEALAYSRDEAGQEQRCEVDLPSLLQSIVDDEVDHGGEASYTGPAVLTITGEPLGLRRAFTNLIVNGLRYGDSVCVELSEAAGQVLVNVTDQGPGIPPEARGLVLEPFMRLEGSRNRATGGSGLGLTIVRNIVARHAGELAFLDDGPGFTVQVRLPV